MKDLAILRNPDRVSAKVVKSALSLYFTAEQMLLVSLHCLSSFG